eukprot:jgi/Bigna1/143167/aug1.76_g17875
MILPATARGNRRVCSSLDIVAVATAVAALFVIAASAWGGEDFFYGYEHHQLGWSCCGSADVPEWNEIAERLKSTHYKDNLLGSTEYKGMSYLMRVKQKMEEAQYLDLDEYATRNKEYTEAVAQRPKTEAEEEQRFRRAMTKYQNEIDRLKKAIEEEKAKLKTKGKKGSRRKKATTT